MTAHIEIRGLDYSYPDGSRALSGINLRIESKYVRVTVADEERGNEPLVADGVVDAHIEGYHRFRDLRDDMGEFDRVRPFFGREVDPRSLHETVCPVEKIEIIAFGERGTFRNDDGA